MILHTFGVQVRYPNVGTEFGYITSRFALGIWIGSPLKESQDPGQ